jgi:molybdopterin converting factor small subunit
MTLEVKYFASLAEKTGCASETVEFGDGGDIAALWDELGRRHPSLRELPYRPMVACDLQYADWGHGLDGVSEVAFLPPVSGG